MGDLTVKQEKFCQFYVETGNASEAYRQAYDSENMSDKDVWNEAYDLKNHPGVSPRIKELMEQHAKRHEVTVDSLTLELEHARKLAHQIANPSAAVSATMGKAKIHGLIIEKSEVKADVELSNAKSVLLRGLIPNTSTTGTDSEN
jgi:phage terminase small subunit